MTTAEKVGGGTHKDPTRDGIWNRITAFLR